MRYQKMMANIPNLALFGVDWMVRWNVFRCNSTSFADILFKSGPTDASSDLGPRPCKCSPGAARRVGWPGYEEQFFASQVDWNMAHWRLGNFIICCHHHFFWVWKTHWRLDVSSKDDTPPVFAVFQVQSCACRFLHPMSKGRCSWIHTRKHPTKTAPQKNLVTNLRRLEENFHRQLRFWQRFQVMLETQNRSLSCWLPPKTHTHTAICRIISGN